MKRGRKSANELTTLVVDVGKQMPARAPAELTDAQAAVWRATAAALTSEWLTRAAYPILTDTVGTSAVRGFLKPWRARRRRSTCQGCYSH